MCRERAETSVIQGRNQRGVCRPGGADFPVFLSPAMLASLLNLSPKTIYQWIARGHLDGAFRKRGKHVLIWRDRAIDVLFNGKTWSAHEPN